MGLGYATMNIHICGLNKDDKDFYKDQMKSLNILFPSEDKGKSTSDYKVKYSKKPKWKSFIYSDDNAKNFSLINKTIQTHIKKFNDESAKRKVSEEEKADLKNHMIICYVNDNSTDSLLCEQFQDDETIDTLADNFPLILFILKEIDRNNT